jgi:hypothetical protein
LNQYNDFKDSVSKASMDLGNQLESEQEIAKIIDDIVQGSLQ